MQFSSYIFMFVFLPVSVLGYYAAGKTGKYKNSQYFLLLVSIWFYAYADIRYLPVLAASILMNYLIFLLLKKYRMRKALLAGAEERLRELLEYFTEPVKVMATDQEIEAAKNVMTQAMTNWDAAVDLSSYHLTAEDWGKIWPDLAQDNPDLFYVMGGTYYTSDYM